MLQLVCDQPDDPKDGDGKVECSWVNMAVYFKRIEPLLSEESGLYPDFIFKPRPTEYLARIQREAREGQLREQRQNHTPWRE